MASSSSYLPCGACNYLHWKCLPECPFSAYFPVDQQQRFAAVHRVFGASNVAKLLGEVHPQDRHAAANSLVYQAEMRLRDPVYGCVGTIHHLQDCLRRLNLELQSAESELQQYRDLGLSIPSHGAIGEDPAVADEREKAVVDERGKAAAEDKGKAPMEYPKSFISG